MSEKLSQARDLICFGQPRDGMLYFTTVVKTRQIPVSFVAKHGNSRCGWAFERTETRL